MKEKKLQMHVDDIAKMYKEAKHKREQIKILAELNLCSESEIKEILRANGVKLPGWNMQVNSKDKGQNDDVGASADEKVMVGSKESVKPAKAETSSAETGGISEKEYSNLKDIKRIKELEDDVSELEKIRTELSEEISKLKQENKKMQAALDYAVEESREESAALYEMRLLAELLMAIDFDELKSTDGIKFLIEKMLEASEGNTEVCK